MAVGVVKFLGGDWVSAEECRLEEIKRWPLEKRQFDGGHSA